MTTTWIDDVRKIVAKYDETFTLNDVYSHEKSLRKNHPGNRNVRAKIRQSLQVLRDQGIVEFIDRGVYRKIG